MKPEISQTKFDIFFILASHEKLHGAFLPEVLAAEMLPNVTVQKKIVLKGKWFRKKYVIFVQIISAYKNSHEKAEKANEFCDGNHIFKKPDFWNLA